VTAGVDTSGESLAAAHWAAREALRRGVPLRLVHAWEPPGPRDERHREAEETLERAVRSVHAAHPGLEPKPVLLPDSPVAALLTAAGEAEMMVLGSRGLGRVAGFVVGSVSQRVVARSPRPVVLVRAGETSADEHLPPLDGVSPEEIPEIPYREVVLGLDLGHLRDEPVKFAFEAARRRGTALHVVHAVGDLPADAAHDPSRPAHDTPRTLAGHERLLAAALRPWCEKFPGVPVSETVSAGRAAPQLVRASTRACLVVVGRRTPEARLGPHIGSVAHAVLHHVACPVAVVPHA
jgi:nucleotide-binding universal stress UspA family protein